jgi:alpha-glucosidase
VHKAQSHVELLIYHSLPNYTTFFNFNNPFSLSLRFTFKVKRHDVLEVKIIDTEKSLEEVPKNIYKTDYAEDSVDAHDFKFSFERNPFSFTIRRNSTSDIIFCNDDFDFIFSKYYLEISTHKYSNIILGLGERNTEDLLLERGKYTIWNFDQSKQYEDRNGGGNIYGSHPMYLMREASKKYHICFFQNSHGMDVIIDNEKLRYITVGP